MKMEMHDYHHRNTINTMCKGKALNKPLKYNAKNISLFLNKLKLMREAINKKKVRK